MPPEVYTTQSFGQSELDHIFRKDWFCVGRVDVLAKLGDYVTCDKNDELRTFSNVWHDAKYLAYKAAA